MTCTECGMTRKGWEYEVELNGQPERPCCDTGLEENEENLLAQAMAERAEIEVRRILTAALRRSPSPREVGRALKVYGG